MQVLIVDDDLSRQNDLFDAFAKAGLQPCGTDCHSVAERTIRQGWVDLLVMAERVQGRLTHRHALLAEWRNSMVATVLLTPRHDQDIDELFLLLPSLHSLLAPDTDVNLVTRLSIASLTGDASQRLSPRPKAQQTLDDLAGAVPIFASSRMPTPRFELARHQA